MNEAEFTKMTVQETKWSEAAVSEAIESAAKAMETIHSHFITSRHFRINRRLCKRLHSKVTEAVQRVHQTLPSLCGSGLARETKRVAENISSSRYSIS